jgi:hypothetical protein
MPEPSPVEDGEPDEAPMIITGTCVMGMATIGGNR